MRESTEIDEFGFKTVLCPICGHLTLDNHYICQYCKWEYDGAMRDSDYSSANGCTVGEYKLEFNNK